MAASLLAYQHAWAVLRTVLRTVSLFVYSRGRASYKMPFGVYMSPLSAGLKCLRWQDSISSHSKHHRLASSSSCFKILVFVLSIIQTTLSSLTGFQFGQNPSVTTGGTSRDNPQQKSSRQLWLQVFVQHVQHGQHVWRSASVPTRWSQGWSASPTAGADYTSEQSLMMRTYVLFGRPSRT